MIDLIYIRALALASVVAYGVFDYLDSKRVKDEREILIQLKSLELAHRFTLGTLALVTAVYVFFPLHPLSLIFILILAALYTEMIGKLYFRNRL